MRDSEELGRSDGVVIHIIELQILKDNKKNLIDSFTDILIKKFIFFN